MAQDDWDLHAVVKSYTTPPTSTPRTIQETLNCSNFDDDEPHPFSFPNFVFPTKNGSQELLGSCPPFLLAATAQSDDVRTSSAPVLGVSSGPDLPKLAQQQQHQLQHQQPPPSNVVTSPLSYHTQPEPRHGQQQQNQRQQLHQQGNGTGTSVPPLRTMQSQGQRSRKKKSNQRRVILHVTAENLSNDVWAWRKYGQKPIKGSPYPRNYYKCSSSKGCGARKQVERSKTEPNTFIVSYTGDHTHPRPFHRNSLAGSTRNKFPSIQKPENRVSEATNGTFSSPLSPENLSPPSTLSSPLDQKAEAAACDRMKTETANLDGVGILESDDDRKSNDVIDTLIPNAVLNEEFMKGLEELVN